MGEAHAITFIVRISRHPGGHWTGTVERVLTGRKERFDSVRSVGPLIEQALEMESAWKGGPDP